MKLKLFIRFVFIIFISAFAMKNFAQDVVPQKSGDIYSLQAANIKMDIDAENGGRIISLKIDENEILYTNPSTLTGSVLWTSPQSEWGWPPNDEIDLDPYATSIVGNKIYMKSDNVDALNITCSKTYYGNTSDTTINIDYALINTGSNVNTKAAWAVTRVPAEGLSFYPQGETQPYDPLSTYVETIDDISWYEHKSSQNGNAKFKSDGVEGWFAHANDKGYIFIKQFDDVPSNEQAPDEGEIELYLTSDHSYIEMENQGRYVGIPSQDSIIYSVKWYVREIPGEVAVEKGSASLVEFVRKTLNISSEPNKIEKIGESLPIDVYFSSSTNNLKISGQLQVISQICLYDISGQIVYTRMLNSSEESINLDQLKRGVYLYSIYNERGRKTGKFVK